MRLWIAMLFATVSTISSSTFARTCEVILPGDYPEAQRALLTRAGYRLTSLPQVTVATMNFETFARTYVHDGEYAFTASGQRYQDIYMPMSYTAYFELFKNESGGLKRIATAFDPDAPTLSVIEKNLPACSSL